MELRGLVEDQRDPCEALIEFIRRNDARADGRIVEVDLVTAEAFDHDEMVEVPEDDHRQRQVAEVGGLLFITLAEQIETPGSSDYVAGFTAVARDAAGRAQFFQRNEAAVVTEDNGQRGGATLDRLH